MNIAKEIKRTDLLLVDATESIKHCGRIANAFQKTVDGMQHIKDTDKLIYSLDFIFKLAIGNYNLAKQAFNAIHKTVKEDSDALGDLVNEELLESLDFLSKKHSFNIAMNTEELVKNIAILIKLGEKEFANYLIDSNKDSKNVIFELADKISYEELSKILVSRKLMITKHEELLWASANGNLDRVMELVEIGANVNYEDVNGNNEISPLLNAIMNNHLKVVKYLVENGADINSRGGEPIYLSSMRNTPEIVKYLSSKGAIATGLNNISIIEASEIGNIEMVKLLHSYGASLNLAINNAHPNIKQQLIDYRNTIKQGKVKMFKQKGIVTPKSVNNKKEEKPKLRLVGIKSPIPNKDE